MLETITTLLLFQLIGETLSFALRVPIPGPVIGMALLLVYLKAQHNSLARLRPTSLELLRHLSLLFVPAGVGVMVHAARFSQEWLPIVVALIGSTALAIAVTAVVVAYSSRWFAADNADTAPR